MKRTKRQPAPQTTAKKKALIKQILEKQLKAATGGSIAAKPMCWRPPHSPS
jgi:hypothetical protein